MRRARSYSWYPNRKIGPGIGKDQETGLETKLVEVQDIHQDKFNLQEDCQNQVLHLRVPKPSRLFDMKNQLSLI
jgi:hypothetical protein